MKYWDEKKKRLVTQEEKEASEKTKDVVKEYPSEEETTFLMGTQEAYVEEKKPVKKSRK